MVLFLISGSFYVLVNEIFLDKWFALSALKKNQHHIQLELAARLQVLNYLRLNYFYFSCCVRYIKSIFTLTKTKAVATLGGVFALLLAFLFL